MSLQSEVDHYEAQRVLRESQRRQDLVRMVRDGIGPRSLLGKLALLIAVLAPPLLMNVPWFRPAENAGPITLLALYGTSIGLAGWAVAWAAICRLDAMAKVLDARCALDDFAHEVPGVEKRSQRQ